MKFANASELLADLERNGFSISTPIDVDEIASKLGLVVKYDHSLEDEGVTGCIFLDNNGQATVLINPVDNSYEPRRRFTLAHEIGHFCLHLDENKNEFIDDRKTMSRSASYWDTYEAQANTFAAQLLMPKNLIAKTGKQIVSEYRTTESSEQIGAQAFINRMADRFDVSIPAMEYRLQAIGIIKKN